MLFNSIDFALFLPIVFILYWFVFNRHLKLQNFLIVVASYFFYGWWDWRFLLLIFFSSLVDYSIGLTLSNENNDRRRKTLLWISIIANLGLLGFFKYYNFFIDNFVEAFRLMGMQLKANSLQIILPVGISFYTFQTLSYTIDVYRKKLEPTRDFISFSAFVSFFPQLMAGPIERAIHLLPQFYKKRSFDYSNAVDGLKQMLWGLFKKMVIADNCAQFANLIFNHSDQHNGSTLLLGAVFFSFQIYGDFSGYSDIAIGTAKLFGFNLMQNFSFPYFSRDIAEFWRRWHISLTTWFRDYLYIPLGGNQGSTAKRMKNILIIFIVSGFWHGANWTFIAWGFLNALYYLPLLLTNNHRKNLMSIAPGRILPSIKELSSIVLTFGLTVVAWVFFRAENITQAWSIITKIFSTSFFHFPTVLCSKTLVILLILFIIIEWIGRNEAFGIARIGYTWKRPYRWAVYYLIFFSLFLIGNKDQEFIYFQF